MKKLTMIACMLLCVAPRIYAQGRGGRQGGPGGGAAMGPQCLNPADVKQLETRTNSMPVNGVDVPSSVVVITGNPGVGRLLNPCPAGLGSEDPLAKYFFPPELIMSHQQAINLSDSQRTSIRTLMLDAQKTFVSAQFKMSAEVEKLQGLIADSPVDEARVLEEVDRVLGVEREIKREQLSLMIRLKNLLTPQQQDALAKLRSGE